MDGTEYGVDVYVDMISNEPVSIFIKEKIAMRAGETDKSVSVKDEQLFELIKRFVKKIAFKGIIDIDVFKVNGQYYISEVRSEEHTSELQSRGHLVCRLLLEKKNINQVTR